MTLGSTPGDPTTAARVGVVGTGAIFPAYARGLARHDRVRLDHVADIDVTVAKAAAERFGVPRWGGPEALLADPDIDIVVNLTPPSAHADLTEAALSAGKHVYVEKPLALTRERARDNLRTAAAARRVLGCAPETFLGQAGQTARQAVDSGLIGEPFAATSFIRSSRVETWHPSPGFLYGAGGGPVLDLGPYHLAHLVNLFGPVASVLGDSKRAHERLAVTAPGRKVDAVDVTVPTHTSALLQFASGPMVTTMHSFDVWDSKVPHIEVYGTRATLTLPAANRYDEPVLIKCHEDQEWRELPPAIDRTTPDPPKPFRALGVLDLVAHLSGAEHRTSGEFAYHVLDVLTELSTLTADRGVVPIASSVERPAPVA